MNNTYCFNMSDLFSQASYAFIITMPNCKVGKEGIHQLLIEVIKRYGNSYLANKWNRWSNSDGNLTCFYFEEPFGNLRFKELVTITDNAISYKYVEQTDQKVMLPNIQNFIYMMLFAVKTAEQLQGGFEKHSAKCEVKIENNADAYFYEKYNPLAVDYLFLLQYIIGRNVKYEVEMENHNDIYLLFNRFYNQYKSEGSVAKPYITLVKDNFDQLYGSI